MELLDAEGADVQASTFSVVGFDGSKCTGMPILAAWMRMGTKGDDLRWERVHFAVLDSPQYKLILGLDILQPRNAHIDTLGRWLTLERKGVRYSLPLCDKPYALKSSSM